jgi:hypothetical protein
MGTSPRSLSKNRTPTKHNNKEMSCPSRHRSRYRNPDPSLSGSGLEAIRPFQLEEGFTVIGRSNLGNANFIIHNLEKNGNSVAPMGVANVIGLSRVYAGVEHVQRTVPARRGECGPVADRS